MDEEVEEEKRTSVSSTRLIQKIRIEVDTSDYVSKGILSIEHEDRKWRPVIYLSKISQ